MPFDKHLADQMENTLAGRSDIERKKMFGGYCWMLNGNMLCGVEVGRFMFRVGKEQEAEACAKAGAEPVIFGNRKMGGIVWVEEKAARKEGLENWITFAENFVGAQPAK